MIVLAFDAPFGCAGVECTFNSDCGDHARCVVNRCVRDCASDRDCPDGQSCSPNGECRASTDAGAPDASMPPDAAANDTGTPDDVPDPPRDVATFDEAPIEPPRDVVEDTTVTFDLGVPDIAREDLPRVDTGSTDLGTRPDTGSPDAGTAVSEGVYDLVAVRPDTLLSPVAVAWHPGGAYALICAAGDAVYRYDRAAGTVAMVARAGTNVRWQALAFTADGARAMLLANTTTSGVRRGRFFVWDHASSMLTERTDLSPASETGFESIKFAPDGSRAAVLLRSNNVTTVRFHDATGAMVGTPAARGMVAGTGCNDLAWVTDGFGEPAIAIGCGVSTAEILQLDNLTGTPRFTQLVMPGQVSNVSQVSAHPRGHLALAIDGTYRLSRYRTGRWDTGFSSPMARSASGVTFNDDGSRALAFGGYGVLTEYRSDLYVQTELTETTIPLAGAPYNQPMEARVTAVAWRPRCDEGLVVGGANSAGRQSAFVVYFRVVNGRRCP